jgi:hypothetical protein
VFPSASGIVDRNNDGRIVYGEMKSGAARDEAKALVARGQIDLSRLDAEVNALVFKLANTFPGCLTKTIESVRKHKLEHDRNRKNRAWLGRMMTGHEPASRLQRGAGLSRSRHAVAAPARGGRHVVRPLVEILARACQAIDGDDHSRRFGSLAAVVRLDARLTAGKPGTVSAFVSRHGRRRVGVAAARGNDGYLLGEVRAFEFGSPPCGDLAAASSPGAARSALVAEAGAFRSAGVATVRTMVRRNDVSLLAFFRSNGFVGGSFTQLELGLPAAKGK